MSTPDQIRAEYIETLARSQSGAPGAWEQMSEESHESMRRRAIPYVDALADAGLLPTQMQQHGMYHDNGRYDWRPTERRYLTAWRGVPE